MSQVAFRRSSTLASPLQALQLDSELNMFPSALSYTVLCSPMFTDWMSGLLSDWPISRSSLALSIEERDNLKGSNGTSLGEGLPDLERREGKWGRGSLLAGGSPECRLTSAFSLLSPPELFRAPVLRVTPSAEPQEGKPVTLSCQTKLPLQRSAARLLFSFYKDGRTVRSRGPSPEFQIPTASEAHSGSYWCEAATEDNQVWKQSPKLEIRVQGEFVCVCVCVCDVCEKAGRKGIRKLGP